MKGSKIFHMGERGQALVEYALIMAVLVMGFAMASGQPEIRQVCSDFMNASLRKFSEIASVLSLPIP